jgi:hypothetical protein
MALNSNAAAAAILPFDPPCAGLPVNWSSNDRAQLRVFGHEPALDIEQ